MRLFTRAVTAVVSAIAVTLTSATLNAQARIRLGLGGGFTFPAGDVGQSTHGGINLMASLTYDPAKLPIGFEANGSYHSFAPKEKSARNSYIMALTGGITIPITGTLGEPYLAAGVGYYNTQGPTTGDVDAERDFGGYGGVGIRFRTEKMQLNIRAGFHEIFAGKDAGGHPRSRELIPITFTIVL